jgi:hypothetical protein
VWWAKRARKTWDGMGSASPTTYLGPSVATAGLLQAAAGGRTMNRGFKMTVKSPPNPSPRYRRALREGISSFTHFHPKDEDSTDMQITGT